MKYSDTDMKDANWDMIPQHLKRGIHNYIIYGYPVGGFLTAVFRNDLRGAVMRADRESLAGLDNILKFFHWYAPLGCIGSIEIHMEWIKIKGMRGKGITDCPDAI